MSSSISCESVLDEQNKSYALKIYTTFGNGHFVKFTYNSNENLFTKLLFCCELA